MKKTTNSNSSSLHKLLQNNLIRRLKVLVNTAVQHVMANGKRRSKARLRKAAVAGGPGSVAVLDCDDVCEARPGEATV